MVRPLAVAAGITVVLCFGVACSNGSDATAPPTSTAGSTVGATKTKGADNTVQVCADVKRLNAAAPRALTATFKQGFGSAPSDDGRIVPLPQEQAGTGVAKALKKMRADTRDWMTGLQQQSEAATDPGLTKALTVLVTDLKPLLNGRFSFERVQKVVTRSEHDLAPYCAGPAPNGSPEPARASKTGVGPGKACPAPISFDTAKKWKPEHIAGRSFSGIPLNRKELTLLCEIDAKPAGITGFIRVWKVRKSATARTALMMAAPAFQQATGLEFHEITVGGQSTLELTYTADGSPGRAFAVTLASGEIIVTDWKGLDRQAHQAGLAAYQLARSSLAFP
jgi:hypothetical protein